MKKVLFFIVGALVGGGIIFGGWHMLLKPSESKFETMNENKTNSQETQNTGNDFEPQLVDFSFAPPSNTVSGVVFEINGNDLTKTHWDSGETIPLIVDSEILPGEPIRVGKDSTIKIKIGEMFKLEAQAESAFNLINSQPTSTLWRQSDGEVIYKIVVTNTADQQPPLSVRAQNFLITIDEGSVRVNLDKDENLLSVELLSGKARIAWENQDYESQLIELETEPRVYSFNTVKLKQIN